MSLNESIEIVREALKNEIPSDKEFLALHELVSLAHIKIINAEIDKIKSDLEKILSNPKHKRKKIVLHLHPFVAAYVSQGWKSERNKWYFNYKKWIKIIPRDAYTYLHYRFFDDKGKVIHT